LYLQLNFVNTDSDNTDSQFTQTNFFPRQKSLVLYSCWWITRTRLTRTFG